MIYYFSLFLIFWIGWLSFFSVPRSVGWGYKTLIWLPSAGNVAGTAHPRWLHSNSWYLFCCIWNACRLVWVFSLSLSNHSVILPIAFLLYGWIPKEWKRKLLSLVRKGHAPELTWYPFCLFLLVKTSHKTSNDSGEAK